VLVVCLFLNLITMRKYEIKRKRGEKERKKIEIL
jgi:hypothetical protein